MKKDKIDLRIIKTKKNLYNALLNLLKEKAFEEIKVSDICETALTNRSTFYTHFEDKYALLDSLIKDLKIQLQEELRKNNKITDSKEYYIEIIKLLLNHIEEKQEIYQSIIINNRNSIAMDMIYDTLNEDITKKIELDKVNNNKKIPSEFISQFYLGAIFNVGMLWIKNIDKFSKKEILEYLEYLILEKN